MTQALRSHFDDYARFHRTPGNKACHSFGIPIIVLASLALLARVPLFALGGFEVTLAELVVVLFVAYYLTLDPPLAVLMLTAYALLDAAGRFIPPWPALGLFVFGWILQGVGSLRLREELARLPPAIFVHLAVGQLWILAKDEDRGQPGAHATSPGRPGCGGALPGCSRGCSRS